MLRKIFIALFTVTLCFGLTGIAFSGESLEDRDIFVFDSTTSHNSMDVAKQGDLAPKDSDHKMDMNQKNQPCAVVIANAKSINDVNYQCLNKYRESYGG